MAGIGQYLKDTHGELRHVAWPTQLQTIVYTILVAVISIAVALYLGFFDFLLTTGLARVIGVEPQPQSLEQSGLQIEQLPADSPELQQNINPTLDLNVQ